MPRPELNPDILLGAYCEGLFPMADGAGELAWFNPDPRAVLPLDDFRISKNLRRRYASAEFDITTDQDFEAVMQACADRPEGTWISEDILDAYCLLHELGFAHSVEARLSGQLVGGLYGVAIGGAFFGESMFHKLADASKVALVWLVERMTDRGFSLLDVQFVTPHLEKFGAIEIPREEYLQRLRNALTQECVLAD